MDYFAIATLGFYPTPTPTDKERRAYAASWGYLSVAGSPSDVVDGLLSWGRNAWSTLEWGAKKWF